VADLGHATSTSVALVSTSTSPLSTTATVISYIVPDRSLLGATDAAQMATGGAGQIQMTLLGKAA